MYASGPRHRGARQSCHQVPGGTAVGLTAQKTSLQATERDPPRLQQARADDRQLIAPRDGRRLTFVDESGVNLALTRR